MKIYYQWWDGAYSHIASNMVAKEIDDKIQIEWVPSFSAVREKIAEWNIWVLPIENSYAGSIHENLYNFLRFEHKIIWELNLDIDHCLLAKTKDIAKIKTAYSHPQALSQCHDFLKENNIVPMNYSDTSTAAAKVSNSDDETMAAIASEMSSKVHNLNILKKGIQDQYGNVTRFFIITRKYDAVVYPKSAGKVSILFEARNIPASLYKCLGAFATNDINLTKIESIPSLKNPFSYIFWVDFQGKLEDEWVKSALAELEFFTNDIKVLGEY